MQLEYWRLGYWLLRIPPPSVRRQADSQAQYLKVCGQPCRHHSIYRERRARRMATRITSGGQWSNRPYAKGINGHFICVLRSKSGWDRTNILQPQSGRELPPLGAPVRKSNRRQNNPQARPTTF